MTSAEILAPARTRPSIQHWRRRSRVIGLLRIALPLALASILMTMIGFLIQNALQGHRAEADVSGSAIRLVNPHFAGRNRRNQPFLLTADTATRDPKDNQRVFLQKPALVVDPDGNPTHILAGAGIYHEDTGKLELSQGVRMSTPDGLMATSVSLFDTKTSELLGWKPVQGVLPEGDLQAHAYSVHDNGDRMVFTGGVHTRLYLKEAARPDHE